MMTHTASPPVPERVTKRTRQPKDKDKNETPQRARKRALDREAQRTFREKTKNYIAYLVETVEACKAENESQLVKQLLEQNESLYRTIEHLRKILTDIYTATEPEALRSNTTNQAAVATSVPLQHQPTPALVIDNVSAQQAASPVTEGTVLDVASLPSNDVISETVQPHVSLETTTLDNDVVDVDPPSINGYFASSTQVIDHRILEPIHDTLFDHLNGPGTWEQAGQGLIDHDSSMTGNQASARDWTSIQFQIPMQSTFNPEMDLYQNLWGITNSVYSKIFDISPSEACAANDANVGIIFKAIRKGWDTLSGCEQANPVVQILGAYDNLISGHMDQVNRAAIAFKNFHLIKVSRNASF